MVVSVILFYWSHVSRDLLGIYKFKENTGIEGHPLILIAMLISDSCAFAYKWFGRSFHDYCVQCCQYYDVYSLATRI